MRDGKSFGGTQFNVAGLKLCSAVSFSDAGHVLISFQLLIASLRAYKRHEKGFGV
jgi:hypothetical protein